MNIFGLIYTYFLTFVHRRSTIIQHRTFELQQGYILYKQLEMGMFDNSIFYHDHHDQQTVKKCPLLVYLQLWYNGLGHQHCISNPKEKSEKWFLICAKWRHDPHVLRNNGNLYFTSQQSFYALYFQSRLHMGHCGVGLCEFTHLRMQCKWKAWLQAPQTAHKNKDNKS